MILSFPLAFVSARPGFVWREPPANNYIDEHVFTKLRTLRMGPSDLCADVVFVRRAYLDLLGILPTAEEARAFVNEEAVPLSMNGPNVPQVLECASPLALFDRDRATGKRQRAAALQDATARPEGSALHTAGIGRAAPAAAGETRALDRAVARAAGVCGFLGAEMGGLAADRGAFARPKGRTELSSLDPPVHRGQQTARRNSSAN